MAVVGINTIFEVVSSMATTSNIANRISAYLCKDISRGPEAHGTTAERPVLLSENTCTYLVPLIIG